MSAKLYDEVTLPLRLHSTANLREHWAAKAKRTKHHRQTAKLMCKDFGLPCIVTITRIAPRQLDDDNLASCCKATRDGVADRLGIDDRDPRVQWRYKQAKGKPKEYAVRVTFERTEEI